MKKKSIPNGSKNKNQSKKTIIKVSNGDNEIKNFKPVHLVNKSKGNTGIINQINNNKIKKK